MIFEKKFPRLPPKSKIDFKIELKARAHPNFKPPHRMTRAKLKELKV